MSTVVERADAVAVAVVAVAEGLGVLTTDTAAAAVLATSCAYLRSAILRSAHWLST